MHEFVLGTKKDLKEHAAVMAKFPEMEHDEPYMAHVAPGRTGEIVWTFNRAGEFDFACLTPATTRPAWLARCGWPSGGHDETPCASTPAPVTDVCVATPLAQADAGADHADGEVRKVDKETRRSRSSTARSRTSACRG